jgi:hypothetical protein
MSLRTSAPILILALLMAQVAVADIVGDICRQATGADTFDRLLQTVRSLQTNPRIQTRTIGTTRRGRPIPMLTVRDPNVPADQTVRLFIVARQHGTEASGSYACLGLAKHFAQSDGELERTLLQQITLVMVPVANPDGMVAGKRDNGAGVDLNRHWHETGEPEIRAIRAAVKQTRPQALIDMHELPASSSKPAFRDNFIQTIGRDRCLAADLSADCSATSARLASWMGQSGLPLNIYYDYADENLKLCHRYFGLGCGIPSYLFEAKCGAGRSLAERIRFHVLGALVVANYALHRYYDPGDEAPAPRGAGVSPAAPLPVATAPDSRGAGVSPAAPLPVATAPDSRGAGVSPAAPSATTVAFAQPLPDQVTRGQQPLVAQVTGMPAGGYIAFAVDGRVKSLTNTAPHEYLLDTRTVRNGRHEISVEVCDASGRTLGTARSVITVDNGIAVGE